eukprot:Hpha_TRINITY_DN2315_c0_g1::TRINITY_DN2315_c0_g1_i1::g.347::m.347/K00799/GST, gst; glutathione S-transferase
MKGMLAAISCACAAAAADPRATLHYFDLRGLAQAPRLLLADAGVTFDEVRHTGDTWPAAKKEGTESGLFPFGQLPAMEFWDENGKRSTVAQSGAILQFLARRYGYYGDGSEDTNTAIDVLAGGVGDLRKRYGAFAYNKDVDTDPSLLENYLKDVELWTGHYDRYVARFNGGFVGASAGQPWGKPTFADILLFDLVDTCVLRVNPDALKDRPNLAAHFALVGSRPGIRDYLDSERNHKWANGAAASWDTPTKVPPHLKAKDEL